MPYAKHAQHIMAAVLVMAQYSPGVGATLSPTAAWEAAPPLVLAAPLLWSVSLCVEELDSGLVPGE